MSRYNQDEAYIEAMGLYLSGAWDEADAAFGRVDTTFPGESFIKLLRGNICYSRGKLDDAVQHYREAV